MFLLCFSIGGIFKRHRCTRDRYDSNHGRLFSSLSFSFSQSFLASRLFNPSFSFTLLTLLHQRISVHRLVAFSLSRENSLSAAKQRDPPDEIWIHVPPFIFHARLPSILLARVPCLPRRSATTVCVGCTAISQASLLSFFSLSFSLSSDLLPLYTRMIVLFRRRRSRLRRLFRCLRRRCHRRLVVVKLSWSPTCLRAAPYDRRVYTYYE